MRELWGQKKEMTRIQQINQARKILKDWLGEGCSPVPIEQAQARADVCLKCVRNYQGSWTWNLATSTAIASQSKLREAMSIKLQNEERLKVCELCGCQLKLKVCVPVKHIHRHTSDQMLNRFPTWCWIRKEITELITNTK